MGVKLKSFILELVKLLKGTIIGKVILTLLASGVSILGSAPFFDKYISAALNKYLSLEASDPSVPLGLLLIFIAVALTIWERMNQIKMEAEKLISPNNKIEKPFVDICNRGISVKEIDDQKVFFDIPYCAGPNANAYHVKLDNALITPNGNDLIYNSGFGDHFPENITLTNELGKAMNYSLHPFSIELALRSYIVVKGTYKNITDDMYDVFDVFKFSHPANSWVRAMGKEFDKIKSFVESSEKCV